MNFLEEMIKINQERIRKTTKSNSSLFERSSLNTTIVKEENILKSHKQTTNENSKLRTNNSIQALATTKKQQSIGKSKNYTT
jgi:hypothetical protein